MSNAYASTSALDFVRAVTLLDAYRASELAHRRAADRAARPEQRELLLRRAHERARFAREIDTEMRSLGCPEPDDFRTSAVQQAAMTAEDDITELTDRAEDQVRAELDRALAAAFHADMTAILERHARALHGPHLAVCDFRGTREGSG